MGAGRPGPPASAGCHSPVRYSVPSSTPELLEQAAEEFDAPRDALVEFSIKRLLPIIAEEQEKHRNRKEILEKMHSQLAAGFTLLQQSEALLGEDDLVTGRLASAIASFDNAFKYIEAYVERGCVIEDF